MYLIDTNIISELRKNKKANKGVIDFFLNAELNKEALYLSAVTIGELRRGVELIRARGDATQAGILEDWLVGISDQYSDKILSFTQNEAHVWGKLRAPRHENAIDKQIAATALTYDLCLVTRNVNDFSDTGVRVLNPFTEG